MKITLRPSPNFNERKGPLDMLVLHYTGMETGEAAIERLCDPEAGVSAHYVVRENGDILKLVDEDKRAWHAGVASWQGDEDLNSRSVGIEIVNGGHDWPGPDGSLPAYPDAQIEAVTELARGIIERWSIPQTRVVGHSDVAPARGNSLPHRTSVFGRMRQATHPSRSRLRWRPSVTTSATSRLRSRHFSAAGYSIAQTGWTMARCGRAHQLSQNSTRRADRSAAPRWYLPLFPFADLISQSGLTIRRSGLPQAAAKTPTRAAR